MQCNPPQIAPLRWVQAMDANHEWGGYLSPPPNLAQTKKNIRNRSRTEKFVICLQTRHLSIISIQGVLAELRGFHQISIPAHHSYIFGLWRTKLYTKWEYTDKLHGKADHPILGVPRSCQRCPSKRGVVEYIPQECLGEQLMPITWPVTCRYGSGTPLQKLNDCKGVQMRVRWRSECQTEK